MEAGGRSLLEEVVDRMAHEIKNPLQAIAVNLEVIRVRGGRLAPEAWEELASFADAIDGAVRLLDRRLRLLVSLARARGEEEAEAVQLATLLEDLVGALRFDAGPAPVRLEPGVEEVPAARARPGRLLHLLYLLLSDLREDAGEVRVRVSPGNGEVFLDLRKGPAPPDGGGPDGGAGADRDGGVGVGRDEGIGVDQGTWERARRIASDAGVEVRRAGEGRDRVLRVALPRE